MLEKNVYRAESNRFKKIIVLRCGNVQAHSDGMRVHTADCGRGEKSIKLETNEFEVSFHVGIKHVVICQRVSRDPCRRRLREIEKPK